MADHHYYPGDNLAAILADTATHVAGDTLWLHEGTYNTGTVNCWLSGTSSNRITIRGWGQDRVQLDIYSASEPSPNAAQFFIHGGYVTFRDLEFYNSRPVSRVTSWPGTGGMSSGNIFRGNPRAYAGNNEYINCIFHDMTSGTAFQTGNGSLVYGCISYNNGWHQSGDGGHNHGFYNQNDNATQESHRLIHDNCITFCHADSGWHCYAQNDPVGFTHLHYITVRKCCAFDHSFGGTRGYGPDGRNFVIGGWYATADQVVFDDNCSYQHNSRGGNWGLVQLGYSDFDTNGDLKCRNNYIVGGPWQFKTWTTKTVTGNTIVSGNVVGQSTGITTGSESGTQTFVWPNSYETGRGHVYIYNWDGNASVSVDLSSVLANNAIYTIHHVFDLWGTAVASGTYTGGSVSIPMNSIQAPEVLGADISPTLSGSPPTHDGTFGAFLVRTTGMDAGGPGGGSDYPPALMRRQSKRKVFYKRI